MEKLYTFEKSHGSNSDLQIKVLGIGGGGCNAVKYMYEQGIQGVEFHICNTDKQSLFNTCLSVPNKLQLGKKLTQGLGAGADPKKGKQAAEESKDEINNILKNTHMLFIAVTMGGGTGTGAAPFIAEIAKNMSILTVAVVTKPFKFEGKTRMDRAESGIELLKKYCDTVIVILNDKITKLYKNSSKKQALHQSDIFLLEGCKSIAEIITTPGEMNVDFADVRRALKGAGTAVMGTSTSKGDKRAVKATEEALHSPLIDDTNIYGAKYVLLSVSTENSDSLSMKEFEEIGDYVREQVGTDTTEIIIGDSYDKSLGDNLRVTIIATGFGENAKKKENEIVSTFLNTSDSSRIVIQNLEDIQKKQRNYNTYNTKRTTVNNPPVDDKRDESYEPKYPPISRMNEKEFEDLVKEIEKPSYERSKKKRPDMTNGRSL